MCKKMIKNNVIVKQEYVDLNIYDLSVHEGYQRNLDLPRANKMAKNFNPNLLDPLAVAKDKDGITYWVIDGQTRLAMAKILNKQGTFPNTISCRLIKDKTILDHARIFKDINSSSKNISAIDRHKADAFRGDPIAVDIDKILKDYDFIIGKDDGSKYTNNIKSIGAVRRIYQELSIDEFRRTFRLLRRTWDGKGKSLHSHIINGLAYFIKRVGPLFNDIDFINKMKFVKPEEIMKNANSMYTSTGGATSGKYYAIATLQHYNKNRTTKKIPDSLLFD